MGINRIDDAFGRLREEGRTALIPFLTVGDPNESVTYFANTLAQNPDRIDLKRGLAKSLVRANRPDEAVGAWKAVVASPGATYE